MPEDKQAAFSSKGLSVPGLEFSREQEQPRSLFSQVSRDEVSSVSVSSNRFHSLWICRTPAWQGVLPLGRGFVGRIPCVAANCALFTLLQEWNHHINGATHSRRCQLLLEMYELEVQ